jgi:glutaredoxin
MKTIIRMFFKTLRVVIGPLMLLWEWISRPPGMARLPALQQKVDLQCQSLALYEYKTCPFCIKVRQEIRRLSLNVERIDAQTDGKNRSDLLDGGGQAKVPCLKIIDPAGNTQWLYESGAIIEYLRARFVSV